MNLGRRRFLVLGAGTGLAVAAGGLLTGCGGGDPALKTGGELVVGLPVYPESLNPAHGVAEEARWVSDPVVEALYAYRDDTTLEPVLAAADPQVSADGLVWTIRLRPGITYAGGAPFDAHSVAACLTRVSSARTAGEWAPYLGGRIGAVTAVDPLTVRIELPKPFGILRQFLANLPIPHAGSLDDPQALVGTGPFAVETVVPGESVRLRRNGEYRGPRPPLDAIEFRVAAPGATRVGDLKAKRIGIDPRLAADQLRPLQKVKGMQAHAVSAPADLVTALNMRRAPFDNIAVRRALAAGIPRKPVRDSDFKGFAVIGQGPIGPATEGWDAAYAPYPEVVDGDRVRVLLGESGVTGPIDFTVLLRADDGLRKPAETLARQWADFGLRARIDEVPGDVWQQRRRAGEFDLAMAIRRPAGAAGRTAFDVLAPAASTHPDNTGYRNAELDRLLEEAWAVNEASRRAKLCRLANEILVRDAVMMPPVYPRFLIGQSRGVESLNEKQMALGSLELATLHLQS
ncbi:ABC transporter substrate-binding protein [Yinghuangia sp. ASG 101]|uniref:ABC transporter substrate-binding protein n=1 Tax=Yinghuangia sp. ASG 101 TaxID=2896848 RepID=UPI001E2FEE82|nr:ABC transporter substrate-binding protein [Yinghuangia sp. ASG 101]UGQ14323.1 ABC transporter substrate-binding protein [Yinghuangia sp. ASG 101]